MASSATTVNPITNSEPADGNTTPTTAPELPTTPTITHYQRIATDFMAALDKISLIIPKLEAAHVSTVSLVHSRLNVPNQFLATVAAAVEQVPELQAMQKLEVSDARDTLQFLDAFRPVLDKVDAFARNLKFTMDARKADLTAKALLAYDVAKGLARDPSSATLGSLVANMKRDLGRRGRPRVPLAVRRARTAAGAGIPNPLVLPAQGDGADS